MLPVQRVPAIATGTQAGGEASVDISTASFLDRTGERRHTRRRRDSIDVQVHPSRALASRRQGRTRTRQCRTARSASREPCSKADICPYCLRFSVSDCRADQARLAKIPRSAAASTGLLCSCADPSSRRRLRSAASGSPQALGTRPGWLLPSRSMARDRQRLPRRYASAGSEGRRRPHVTHLPKARSRLSRHVTASPAVEVIRSMSLDEKLELLGRSRSRRARWGTPPALPIVEAVPPRS